MNAWVVLQQQHQQPQQLLLMGAVAAATVVSRSRLLSIAAITANKFECECALRIVARLVI